MKKIFFNSILCIGVFCSCSLFAGLSRNKIKKWTCGGCNNIKSNSIKVLGDKNTFGIKDNKFNAYKKIKKQEKKIFKMLNIPYSGRGPIFHNPVDRMEHEIAELIKKKGGCFGRIINIPLVYHKIENIYSRHYLVKELGKLYDNHRNEWKKKYDNKHFRINKKFADRAVDTSILDNNLKFALNFSNNGALLVNQHIATLYQQSFLDKANKVIVDYKKRK